MARLAVLLGFTLATLGMSFAQTGGGSDTLAVSYAQQSMAALTGGASVSDVTLTANVTSSDSDSSTGTFSGKGTNQSRIDLNFSSGLRSDVRNLTSSGLPSGAWQQNGRAVTGYAQHNCWIDAVWFFPALSSLAQTANPAFVFKYIAQEQYNGSNVQHIQVFQTRSQNPALAQLSRTDFYLDAGSSLPVGVKFNAHPDDNMGTNLPIQINFGSYQAVNGFQLPFHFQKVFNGAVALDVTLTTAVFNTGLPDSFFTLQ